MLKNMNVTTKIAGGFGLILVLLAAMAAQGIIKLGESSEGFTSYRELARASNLDGRIQANLLLSRIGAIAYTTTGTEESLSQYKERIDRLHDFIGEAEENTHDLSRATLIPEIKKRIADYNKSFTEFRNQKQIEEESLDKVLKSGEVIISGLNTLLESATEREDSFMMAMVQKSMATLYKARLANAYFIYRSKKESDAHKAIAQFENFQETLNEIRNVLYSPADLGLINELTQNNEEYVSNTRSIIDAAVKQAAAKKKLDQIGPEIAELVEQMKIEVMKEQDTLGPRMQASIQSASRTMTITSAVTLIIGILLAFFISRSITSP